MLQYELLETGPDEDAWYNVIIQEGKYQGIVYKYNWVSIPQNVNPDEDNSLPFKFSYDVVDTNNVEFEPQAFEEQIFHILCDIIEQEMTRRDHEPNRNDDPK